LELARQVTAVERADDKGHLDDVSILPDPNVGALTQILREFAPPDTPMIIENVVNDIDTIVRQVRFTGWSQNQNGDRTVRREVRLICTPSLLPVFATPWTWPRSANAACLAPSSWETPSTTKVASTSP